MPQQLSVAQRPHRRRILLSHTHIVPRSHTPTLINRILILQFNIYFFLLLLFLFYLLFFFMFFFLSGCRDNESPSFLSQTKLFNQQISIGSLCVSGFSINCDCCCLRRCRRRS